jgi:hypothetical protein
MLKLKSPQASFYGSYIDEKIVPKDHLPRKMQIENSPAVCFGFKTYPNLCRKECRPSFSAVRLNLTV